MPKKNLSRNPTRKETASLIYSKENQTSRGGEQEQGEHKTRNATVTNNYLEYSNKHTENKIGKQNKYLEQRNAFYSEYHFSMGGFIYISFKQFVGDGNHEVMKQSTERTTRRTHGKRDAFFSCVY